MKNLQVYSYIPQTHTLGPYLRFALWVQGCPFSCPGCMTPDSVTFDGGDKILISDLAQKVIDTPDIEGITISGGEPFSQAAAINKLLCQIKNYRDLGVIVYSGYKFNKLTKMSEGNISIKKLLTITDILIDGLYVPALNDGYSLRGSSNQNIISLSTRYTSVIKSYYEQPRRKIEFHVRKNDIMLVGVPGKDMLEKWKKLKGDN